MDKMGKWVADIFAQIGAMKPIVSSWLAPLLTSRRCEPNCYLAHKANTMIIRFFIRDFLPITEPEVLAFI